MTREKWKKRCSHVKRGISVLCILIIAAKLWASQFCLSISYFQIDSEKVLHSFKIIQLTDLHNMNFGTDNKRLVEMIYREEPDIVCMVGDMLDKNEESMKNVINLVKKVSKKCPVYFSYGNHEIEYEKKYQRKIRNQLEKVGVEVLDNEYQEITVNGQEICIGGASGYALTEAGKDKEEYDFLRGFEQNEKFKLLLCHVPAGMLLWGGLEKWNIDLSLSGHEHGGQIRLPVIGGIYSQDEGFFPEYTDGKYEKANHTLILSRGLGSGKLIPRFNNIPEIVCIELF